MEWSVLHKKFKFIFLPFTFILRDNGTGISVVKFFEFRIRIEAKVPDPCGSGSRSNPCYLSIFGYCKQNHLKFNHKEESINYMYLPFSISYYRYSPTIQKVQDSKRNNIFIYLFFHILLDPDPEQ